MILIILFLEFFKIGLFTFGGGYAMIPLVEETVLKHNWLKESEFYNLIGVCESTPGPVAINMATYVGSNQAGLLGSIVATLGVVLPSFIIILIIASVMKNLTKNRFVKSFMEGVKPIIAALIISTGVLLLIKAIGFISLLQFKPDFISIIILVILCIIYFVFTGIFKKKVSAIALIIISAGLGIAVSLLAQAVERAG